MPAFVRAFMATFLVAIAMPAAFAQTPAARPPEALLPAGCVAFLRYDGYEPHKKAYDQTALAKVMNDDLGDTLEALVDLADKTAEANEKLKIVADALRKAAPGFWKHGIAAGLELDDLEGKKWRLTIVLPHGINPPYRHVVRDFFRVAKERVAAAREKDPDDAKTEFVERQIRGRPVQELHAKADDLRLAWWYESPHAVLTLGTLPPDDVVAVADGKAPNLTGVRDFRRLADFKLYETDIRGFVDLRRLVDLACRPEKTDSPWEWLGQALGTRAVAAGSGLTGLGTVSLHLGFEGKYQRSTILVDVPEPSKRVGVLRLPGAGLEWNGTIDQLPIPPDADSVAVRHIAWGRVTRELIALGKLKELADTWDTIRESDPWTWLMPGSHLLRPWLVRDADKGDNPVPAVAAPMSEPLWEIARLVAKDIDGALEPTYVSYSAFSEGPFGLGTVWTLKIKDRDKLDALLTALEEKFRGLGPEPVRGRYRGVELRSLSGVGFIQPTYAIHDGWLVVGLLPQPVKGFIWRGQPDRKRWAAPENLAILFEKSRKGGPAHSRLGSVHVDDPRPSVTWGLSILSPYVTALSQMAGQIGGKDAPFNALKLPHAQAVNEHLFPNVTFHFDDGNTLRWDSHFSIDLPWQAIGVAVLSGGWGWL